MASLPSTVLTTSHKLAENAVKCNRGYILYLEFHNKKNTLKIFSSHEPYLCVSFFFPLISFNLLQFMFHNQSDFVKHLQTNNTYLNIFLKALWTIILKLFSKGIFNFLNLINLSRIYNGQHFFLIRFYANQVQSIKLKLHETLIFFSHQSLKLITILLLYKALSISRLK